MSSMVRTLLRALAGTRGEESGARDASDAPAVALALGGGFARGFAHLGVLRVLEEEGVRIAGIAGSSIGSILGAAYASGLPLERIIEVCREIRMKDISRWRLSRMGLSSNDRLGELIRRCFPVQTFEQMRVPLAVVTSDLGSGEAMVFSSGDIVEPIRASCAYPGLFEPITLNGRCLADGGIVAPVPAQAASRLAQAWPGRGRVCVVGVSVCFSNWNGTAPANLFQMISRSISAAQKNGHRLWERFADLVIEPDVRKIEWDRFERADEAIAAGTAAVRRALPRLRELLQEPSRPRQARVTPISRALPGLRARAAR